MKNLKHSILACVLLFLLSFGNANAFMFWNQAAYFNAQAGSYITAPNSNTLNITSSFSTEMWIIPYDVTEPQIQALVEKTTPALNTGYTVFLNNGRVGIRTNGITRLVGTTVLSQSQWTHISAVYDASANQFAIYVNGNLDASAIVGAASPLPNTDSLRVGRSVSGSYFKGLIDELRIWKKSLTQAEVQKFMRTTLGSSTGIYSSLVLSYTFQAKDASSTYFTTKDWSGNGNDGNNVGAIAYGQADRPSSTIALNDCVKLDGVNDYFYAPDGPDLSPTVAVTLEAWVYPTSTAGTRTIFHKGPAGGASNYALRLNSGVLSAVVNNVNLTTTISVQTNRWSHVAFTYNSNNGNYFFYLNGNKVSSGVVSAGGIPNGPDDLYFGSNGTGQFFQGLLDEMRIANYVKTEYQINRFLFESVEQSNQPFPALVNVCYNLDGYAISNSDNGNTVTFVSDAGFSGSSAFEDSPVSPLNRADALDYDDGFMMTTAFKRAPQTGTSGMIVDSFEVCLDTTISDLNLYVALNHSAEEEVEISLQSPSGHTVKVFDNNVLTAKSDNVLTIFNDQSDSVIANSGRYTGLAPQIRPASNLNSVFQGKRTAGYWKLIVNDQTGAGTGLLYSWGVQFNNAATLNSNLCLRVFMEGFYRPDDSCVVDTVDVYLRNDVSPYQYEVGVKGETPDDNYTFRYTFDSASLGSSYYLQIRHRNSIQIWSANPVTFDFLNGNLRYDFTLSADSAYGSNQVQVDSSPLRFAMYGGDVNQDDIVDGTDTQLIDNDAAAFLAGYVVTDVNGDDFVDGTDASITGNNADAFISAITP
ncbi:MAG: proprotein convertase P-domain-containing protein [Ignavibacteria bacterium]|nr:proprotein convertase P-domain-containing protein [Ignavibacteria bacterium]